MKPTSRRALNIAIGVGLAIAAVSMIAEVISSSGPRPASTTAEAIASAPRDAGQVSAIEARRALAAQLTADAGPVSSVPDASVRVARGSLDERHASAAWLRTKGFTVRTTGPDETVLEITNGDGCDVRVLNGAASGGGLRMVEVGFTRLKCIGGDAFVDLLDENGDLTRMVGVAAMRLFSDYKDNEVAADIKYRGKSLRVIGRITRIGKGLMDDPFVELATSNQFEGVRAHFASEEPLVALKKGQDIAVRCTGKGMSIGSPLLGDCALE